MKTEYEQLGPNGVQRKTWSGSAKRNCKTRRITTLNCTKPAAKGRRKLIGVDRNELEISTENIEVGIKKWPKRKPTGLAQEQGTEKTGE